MFRAYLRAVGLAESLQRDLSARHGLSVADFHAVRALARLGEVPIGRLGAELGVPRSTRTNLVDRLEAAGLVERRARATDRRVVAVRLTPAGERAVGDTDLFRRSLPARHLLALTAAEQVTLAELLERLVEVRPEPTRPGTESDGK